MKTRYCIIFCLFTSLLFMSCSDGEQEEMEEELDYEFPYLDREKLTIKHNQEPAKDNIIRVLSIGNSYSYDALQSHLHNILIKEGLQYEIGVIMKSSCSIEQQLIGAMLDETSFTFAYENTKGERTKFEDFTIEEALTYLPWNYISLQQFSAFSGKYNTISPFLPYMIKYVKNNTPVDVKLIWHQTWAYDSSYENTNFGYYDNDQELMYSSICETCKQLMDDFEFDDIAPSGTAIQKMREALPNINLTKDGTHLSEPLGRYVASCVWYEILTHKDVRNVLYAPSALSSEEIQLAKTAAHTSIEEWK